MAETDGLECLHDQPRLRIERDEIGSALLHFGTDALITERRGPAPAPSFECRFHPRRCFLGVLVAKIFRPTEFIPPSRSTRCNPAIDTRIVRSDREYAQVIQLSKSANI